MIFARVIYKLVPLPGVTEEEFEAFMGSGCEEAEDYRDYYSQIQNVTYRQLVVGPELGWPDFLGDYIVYDERIILKFDADTKNLMLLVGQEVIAQHMTVFTK